MLVFGSKNEIKIIIIDISEDENKRFDLGRLHTFANIKGR